MKMLLGKRPRPPFKRTTSMTGMTVDLSDVEVQEAYDLHQPSNCLHPAVGIEEAPAVTQMMMMNFSPSLSPRNLRTLSGRDHVETSHFLRTCGFCHRRLSAGRDIYMYRGDTAFCSLECREKQMKQDERNEKLTGDFRASAPGPSNSRGSRKSQTVAYT